MITAQEFARKKKVSLRVARRRLEEQVKKGLMQRKKGPSNLYLYCEVPLMNFRWHDPFNRCKHEMA